MAVAVFGEYRPDVNDLGQKHTQSLNNVLPIGAGYGPFQSLSPLTDNMPAACRGGFLARVGADIHIFAGTTTNLYRLNNTTLVWAEVSKGGSDYTPLSDGHLWKFAQFNNRLIAVQQNTAPQAFDIGTDSAFADLDSGAPAAAYIAIINRFVVLAGLASNPTRIQWSGLNDTEEWVAGVNLSDFQDLPDGGVVNGIAGGDVGLVLQESSIRQLLFAPGSDVVFQIKKIGSDVGLRHPHTLVTAGEKIFFYSFQGFVQMSFGGSITRIGAEKTDNFFNSNADPTYGHLIQGVSDPVKPLVYFTFRSLNGPTTAFDVVLAYNWFLQRWGKLEFQAECLMPAATPGITLEGLSLIAPGAQAISGAADNGAGLVRIEVASTATYSTGEYKEIIGVVGTVEANGSWFITVIDATHFDLIGSAFADAYVSGGTVGGSVDAMEQSLDSISTVSLTKLGAVDSDHELGFFTGDNLEAYVELAEQGNGRSRSFIGPVHPVTDSATALVSVGRRENLNAAVSYTAEGALNALGLCPQRVSCKYARLKLRIPAATVWTYMTGIDPEGVGLGRR